MPPNPEQAEYAAGFSDLLKATRLPDQNILSKLATEPYIVCKDLVKCLQSVNKDFKFISTRKEISDALKDYIFTKHLYDDECPFIIRCKDDDLSRVFGASEFTIMDVKRMLQKLSFPVNCNDSSEVSCCSNSCNDRGEKRKLEDGSEKEPESAAFMFEEAKKLCVTSDQNPCNHTASQQPVSLSPMILHVPPSPNREESDAVESAYSYQEYETALATDSSDDNSISYDDVEFLQRDSVVAIEETYDIEYEIVTDSESDLESVDTDCEIEQIMRSALITFICKTDSDQEFWADGSSDELSGSDIEISEHDKWKCDGCRCLNDPATRCCQKCWKGRSGWLAEARIPRKRKKPRSRKKYKKSSGTLTTKKEEPPLCCQNLDLPSTSQGSSCSLSTLPSSQECAADNNAKLCLLCCVRPADSSIVHGKYAHTVSCYRCARKLQHNGKPCPICRREIEKVVYNIS